MNTKIKTALLISIICNALLIGLILGEFSHSFSHYLTQNTPSPVTTDCCSSELVSQLPEEKRQLLKKSLQPAWELMQDARTKINTEKKKTLDLLKAEPFDEKAYRNQIRHMNEMHTQMKRDMSESVIKTAKQFSPEERVILADIVSRLSVPSTPATPAKP